MPMQTWSTEQFSDREQFSVWREVICEAFGALDPQRSPSTDMSGFPGRVQLIELDTIRGATVEAPAHVVRREQSEIRRDPQEAFFVNLQLAGSCGIRQAGRDAVVTPGDFVVLDLTRPYTIDVRPDFSIICLRVPRERLIPFVGDPKGLVGFLGRAQNAQGRIAASFIRELWAQGSDVTDVAAGRLGHVLAELIGIAMSGEQDIIRQSETTTMLRARSFIRRELGEADLSPAKVAKELRISVRTLHALFEHSEQSFAAWVRQERIERCAADLRNPCDKRTISEIAFRWGFSDSSHFSRVFKSAFGRSPRDFRHEKRIAQIGMIERHPRSGRRSG